MILLNKLKSYLIYIGAGLLTVLYALVRIKSHQVESLKQKARETRLRAARKQKDQIIKTMKSYQSAHEAGEWKIDKIKQDIASGKRRGFGQLHDD